jgi:hypothetical protein
MHRSYYKVFALCPSFLYFLLAFVVPSIGWHYDKNIHNPLPLSFVSSLSFRLVIKEYTTGKSLSRLNYKKSKKKEKKEKSPSLSQGFLSC